MSLSLFLLDPTYARIRREVLPVLPQSCMFTIPEPYKLTIDGQRFLLIDESRVRRERLLVYASDIQLDILFDSPVIYMDGTFSKTPPYFLQIYTIHAVKHDTCERSVIACQTILFSSLKVYLVHSH